MKKLTILIVGFFCLSATVAFCQDSEQEAASKPFSLFGDVLEDSFGIKAFGYLKVGYSKNDTSTHAESAEGSSNHPVAGPSDEQLQLNSLIVALNRPIKTSIIPRATPLPGPKPEEFSWGFWTEALYGRDALPALSFGFDDEWAANKEPKGVAAGSNRQNYLAMPQVFVQLYAPFYKGMALTLGRFGSGVGHEIPSSWRPSPNIFYSKTFVFLSQPDQVTGALLSAKLMENKFGMLAAEFGVVNGRQNWQDNNDDKSFIGALRWRSPNMSTWLDYSFMVGNEQNDLSKISEPQMPTSRVISPRGQLREHHSLSLTMHPTSKLTTTAEVVYGKQHADGRADTIDALTGPNYKGGSYMGGYLEFVYASSKTLRYAIRGEHFRDRKNVALFPITAVSGDFNAVTAGVQWDAHPNVLIRPEIRYDWQAHNDGVNAYGNGRDDKQTTFSVDMTLYF